MSSIRIPVNYFTGPRGPGFVVEGYEGNVYLTVEAEDALGADPARSIALETDEARALAAALVHYAEGVERRGNA